MCAFLVGGTVRDIFLGYPVTDIDIAVMGDAVSVARDYARSVGGALKALTAFGTCKVEGGPVGVVDFAATRMEKYRRPGALPNVELFPHIIADLERRDFAINAMALCLSPGYYGELTDPFGGREDVFKKQLAVLHPGSFTDDPTRMLRGVRFAARYGYCFEKHTLRFLRDCIRRGCLGTVSGKRVRRELELIFSEESAPTAIRMLLDLGILGSMGGNLKTGAGVSRLLPAAVRTRGRFSEWAGEAFDSTRFWFAYLFVGTKPSVARRLAAGFNLDRRTKEVSLWAGRDLCQTEKRLSRLKPPYAHAATRLFAGLPLEALALLYAGAGRKERDTIRKYVMTWRKVKPGLKGADLVALGMKPGPAVGRMLDEILELKLRGRLPTRRSELAFARKALRLG